MSAPAQGLHRVSWCSAVAVHAGRFLRRWSRSPVVLGQTIGMPVLMVVMIVVLFGGMIEQFTGRAPEMTGIAVMVGFS